MLCSTDQRGGWGTCAVCHSQAHSHRYILYVMFRHGGFHPLSVQYNKQHLSLVSSPPSRRQRL